MSSQFACDTGSLTRYSSAYSPNPAPKLPISPLEKKKGFTSRGKGRTPALASKYPCRNAATGLSWARGLPGNLVIHSLLHVDDRRIRSALLWQ